MSAIPHRSNIYLCAGLLGTLIAFVGFWPTYFGPLLAGTLAKTQIIHVHAVVQVVWLALLVTQIALAATGRIRQHMRLGNWVFAWGLVVIVVGLVLSFEHSPLSSQRAKRRSANAGCSPSCATCCSLRRSCSRATSIGAGPKSTNA